MSVIYEVPSLLVGFDIESTGLDTQSDEPISYGFSEFAYGQFVSNDEFFVLPNAVMHPGAQAVHGVSFESLQTFYREGHALSSRGGATRASRRLLSYASRGATFVGANPMFDYEMLDATLRRNGQGGLLGVGFSMDQCHIVDVVAHDHEIDDDRVNRPRRGLAHLCEFYGVEPGKHRASLDARAAVNVLLAQIRRASTDLEVLTVDAEFRNKSNVAR